MADQKTQSSDNFAALLENRDEILNNLPRREDTSPYAFDRAILQEQRDTLRIQLNQGLEDLSTFQTFEEEQLSKLDLEKREIEYSVSHKLNKLYEQKRNFEEQYSLDFKKLEDELKAELLTFEQKYSCVSDEDVQKFAEEKREIEYSVALKLNELYSQKNEADRQFKILEKNLEDEIINCEKKYMQLIDLRLLSIAYNLMPFISERKKRTNELNLEMTDIFWQKVSLVFTPQRIDNMFERKTTEAIMDLFRDNNLYQMVSLPLSTEVYANRDIDLSKNRMTQESLQKGQNADRTQEMFYLLLNSIIDNADGFLSLSREFNNKPSYKLDTETPEKILRALATMIPFCNTALYTNSTASAYNILGEFPAILLDAQYAAWELAGKAKVKK